MPVVDSSIVREADLYFNFYRDADPARRSEIEACALRNAGAGFNRVFSLVAVPDPPPEDASIQVIRQLTRPTFDDFIRAINARTAPGRISVLANADIWFDRAFVERVRRLDLPRTCLALSRWDDTPGGIVPFVRRDSQDLWVFQGVVAGVRMPYYLGRLGCDNRFAHELVQAGYDVVNPSRTLRAFHLHRTGRRNYRRTPEEIVPRPYLRVDPTELKVAVAP